MIQVTKKWFIDSDGSQYILFKKEEYFSEKNNETKEKRTDMSYHSTVSSALTQLLRKIQRKKVKQNDMTLKQAIDEFNKMEQMLVKSAQGREI